MQIELWQLIVGGITAILIGGAGGGGLFWALVESRRIETTAENAATKQALATYQSLADEQQQWNRELHTAVQRQGQRLAAQEELIASLQKLLSSTRAELAEAERQIDALKAENTQLMGKLEYERRRRRELEKRVRNGHD